MRCALPEIRPEVSLGGGIGSTEPFGELSGPVVVLYGDMPLLTAESLGALCETRGRAPAAALTAQIAIPTTQEG